MLVSLTPLGKEHVDRVSPLVQRVNDRLFANISAADFKILGDTCSRIALNSQLALAELRMQKLESAAGS